MPLSHMSDMRVLLVGFTKQGVIFSLRFCSVRIHSGNQRFLPNDSFTEQSKSALEEGFGACRGLHVDVLLGPDCRPGGVQELLLPTHVTVRGMEANKI